MGNSWSSIRGYNKQAQSSGVSPSSTEESNSKGVLDQGSNDDGRTSISNQEEKPPEEPESNDTSYGVEATAVRTLAASTGTVAILGTTAQSQSQKDLRKVGDSPEAVCTQPLPGATTLVKTDEKTVVPQTPDEKESFSEPTNDAGKDTKDAPELEAKDEEKTSPDSPVTVKEIKTEDPKIPEDKNEIPPIESKPKSPESDKTLEEPDTKASTESDIKSENGIKPADQLTKDLQQPLVDKIEESEVTSKAEPITEQKPNEAESLVSESLPAVASSEEPTADKDNEITTGEVKSDSLSEALIQSPNASSEDTSKVPEVVSPDEKTVVKESVELNESVADEIQAEKPKKTDEIQSPNQDENSESLSAENEVSLPSPDGNTRTNDDEDNDISSEQLKTNSLSDVSMSETVQSEVEEKSLVGEQLSPTVESENKDSEITKEMTSPAIEVSSPSDASVKNNSEGTSEILPDSKTNVTSLDEKSQNSSSNDADLNAAATTIQSTIRGFLVRKQLQGSQNSSNEDLSKKLTDSMIEKVKDEVNDICKEAEKTTESLISSPDIDKDAIIPNEEFPAPPDDMLTEARDETTTSLNSQPTVPSSESQKETNIQDGKSDETQAEPLKENALDAIPPMPADDNSTAVNEQLPNDEDLPAPDFEMLESSYTEDMNTEIANDSDKVTNAEDELKDSTENDLTIDEDSEKQLKELQKPQECDELRIAAEQIVDLTQKEIDNAATKIQAGVRGFLTRKQQSKKGKKNGAETPKESLSSPTGNGGRIDDSAVDKEVWNTLESEINKAATTIQANFRGYMVRKEGKNGESPDVSQDTVTFNSEPPSSLNGTNSPITAKDDAPPSSEGLTTNGTEAESKKDNLDTKEEPTKGDDSTQKSAESKNLSEDLINDSALKIQAGVRGYLVRKKQQSEKEAAAPIKTETSNNDQN